MKRVLLGVSVSLVVGLLAGVETSASNELEASVERCAILVHDDDVSLAFIDEITGHWPQLDSFWFVGTPTGFEGLGSAELARTTDGLRYAYAATPAAQAAGIDQKAAIRFSTPYDASQFAGVEFSIRADRATTIRVEVASQDRGLNLELNSDDWKSSKLLCVFEVTLEPRTYRVVFGDFRDDAWLLDRFPDATPGVNVAGIWEVQFYPNGESCVFYIQSVAFFRPSDALSPKDAPSALAGAVIPGLEYLGNPFLSRYPNEISLEFARTVWDMQIWNGRIYFGHGDSGGNAGPIDVWYYAPDEAKFTNELSVDDEQIDHYCAIGTSLFIPGWDATESWDFGNLYINDGTGWQKRRTIPNAIHVHDLATYESRLYAVGSAVLPGSNPPDGGGFIGVSDDEGKSWRIEQHLSSWNPDGPPRESDASNPGVERFMSLFELQGELYASCWGASRTFELGPTGFSPLAVDPFPGIASRYSEPPLLLPSWAPMTGEEFQQLVDDPKVGGYIARSVHFLEQLVYIGATRSETLYRPWRGIGVFAATAMQNGQIRRTLDLGASWEPRDVVVAGDRLYVLSVSTTEAGFRSRVDVTHDLDEWTLAANLVADAPAFSIEVLDGYLYVGLGGAYPSSGNVYRMNLPGG